MINQDIYNSLWKITLTDEDGISNTVLTYSPSKLLRFYLLIAVWYAVSKFIKKYVWHVVCFLIVLFICFLFMQYIDYVCKVDVPFNIYNWIRGWGWMDNIDILRQNMTSFTDHLIKEICTFSDNNGTDRDKTIILIATTLLHISENATFEFYGHEEQEI